MPFCRLILFALLFGVLTPTVQAQVLELDDDRFEPREVVYETVSQILSRPEFRHFHRIQDAPRFPSGQFPFPGWDGGQQMPDGNQGRQQWDGPAGPDEAEDAIPPAAGDDGQIGDGAGKNERADADPANAGNGRNIPLPNDRQRPPVDPLQNDGNPQRPDAGAEDQKPQPIRNRNRTTPSGSVRSSGSMWGLTPQQGRFGSIVAIVIKVIAYLILALVVGFLGAMVVSSILKGIMGVWSFGSWQRQRRPRKATTDDLEEDADWQTAPVETHLSWADELASRGRYRDALRQMVLAAMSELRSSGLIIVRSGDTPRDCLRMLRRLETHPHSDALTGRLKALIRSWEPVGFGRRNASREQYESAVADLRVIQSTCDRIHIQS